MVAGLIGAVYFNGVVPPLYFLGIEMKQGYIDLDRVITDPSKALDKILNSYFYSDTGKHGVNLPTNSLRSDMVDGSDVAGNIQRSLETILGAYFEVFTVEAVDNGVDGNRRLVELTVSVRDGGRTISFDNILNVENGALKGITDVGHL